ncbi:calcium/sodium antiporter [Pelagibacterium montanilacus]|uniref:calcium/sodium antiporter n=1 Tax=Pelagibacterium montanilacus TaxID=2185280 RepID=UPI000F8C9FB0|nr:calcium/sodium antiporter [Pelagibacterium montanilacus]
MTYLLFALGLMLLVAGGEGFVRGAVAIATRLGLSPLLIGLTLVGFGTSLPELVTSVQAAFDGAPGIAVGNVVGSNIANILLILGVTALICPVVVDPSVLRRDGTVLVMSALAGLAIVLMGSLGRFSGILLILALLAYVAYCYRTDRPAAALASSNGVEGNRPAGQPLPLSIVLIIGGLALTILGARLVVSSAIEIASAFGVSETIIGLTVVAVGTSLPELITSVIAAIRRHTDLALGNIIGSNIFNVLFILGVTALARPIPVPPEIARLDIWVMLAATALLMAFGYSGRRLVRWEGAAFLLAYCAYVAWLASGF